MRDHPNATIIAVMLALIVFGALVVRPVLDLIRGLL